MSNAGVTVHIGVHRTGTSALQHALGAGREALRDAGVSYPTGHVLPDNHVELGFACLRPRRLAEVVPFFDQMIRQHAPDRPKADDPAWRELARELVSSAGPTVLSTETLAWIRHDDEFDSLLDLVGGSPHIVVAHREPTEFLASYYEMARFATLHPPSGPDSLFYTEPDSWLADAGARIRFWTDRLGAEHVVAIDYDDVMRASSSMTSTMVTAMGLDPALVSDHAEIRLNQRSDLPTFQPDPKADPDLR